MGLTCVGSTHRINIRAYKNRESGGAAVGTKMHSLKGPCHHCPSTFSDFARVRRPGQAYRQWIDWQLQSCAYISVETPSKPPIGDRVVCRYKESTKWVNEEDFFEKHLKQIRTRPKTDHLFYLSDFTWQTVCTSTKHQQKRTQNHILELFVISTKVSNKF